jgi:hypothetical protein
LRKSLTSADVFDLSDGFAGVSDGVRWKCVCCKCGAETRQSDDELTYCNHRACRNAGIVLTQMMVLTCFGVRRDEKPGKSLCDATLTSTCTVFVPSRTTSYLFYCWCPALAVWATLKCTGVIDTSAWCTLIDGGVAVESISPRYTLWARGCCLAEDSQSSTQAKLQVTNPVPITSIALHDFSVDGRNNDFHSPIISEGSAIATRSYLVLQDERTYAFPHAITTLAQCATVSLPIVDSGSKIDRHLWIHWIRKGIPC